MSRFKRETFTGFQWIPNKGQCIVLHFTKEVLNDSNDDDDKDFLNIESLEGSVSSHPWTGNMLK